MIITDRLVMVNFPKTGSSFARSVLREVHRRREMRVRSLPLRILRRLGAVQGPQFVELMLPNIDKQNDLGRRDQHGTLRQIPAIHRDKTVVSITRNPLDRYVSAYLYGWWRDHPLTEVETIMDSFPRFPDLSFAEYLDMLHRFGKENRLKGITPQVELGLHTIQFIQFYFEEPSKVLRRIDADYIAERKYLEDMGKVTFLHQESLNRELFEFLLRVGYREEDVAFVATADRVNVTPLRRAATDVQTFYTEELVERVLHEDSLVFDLFPEYRGWHAEGLALPG
jgi:hypothetical protein